MILFRHFISNIHNKTDGDEIPGRHKELGRYKEPGCRKEPDSHREPDGYALVENMLVLPIVFLVVYALLFAGFLLHAQCTIESAARRGVLYAGKLACDPQYTRVTASASDPSKGELNEMSSLDFNFTYDPDMSYQPYRYLFGSNVSGLDGKVVEYVRGILGQSTTWMFRIDDDSVVCETKNHVLNQNIKVAVTAKYHLPKVFGWLGIPESYELKSEAVAVVSDQDEFIRNADYVARLLEEAADKTGIKDKVGSAIGEPLKKLKAFMDKLF